MITISSKSDWHCQLIQTSIPLPPNVILKAMEEHMDLKKCQIFTPNLKKDKAILKKDKAVFL